MTADPKAMSTTLGRGATSFDYEAKTWGGHEVRLSPTYLGALRLRYCLEDLEGVRGRVVEVGCGGGGMARALKFYRPDLQVIGCDLSRNAARVAGRMGSGIEYAVANAYELPYASESLAGFVMFDVLEHVEDPGRLLKEAYRVLAPDGLLHMFVPCEGEFHTLHDLLARVGWRAKELYGGHIQRFALTNIKQLLASVGFSRPLWRWSCHLVNQLADVAYFTVLNLRGRNSSTSVEGYLHSSGRSPLRSLVRAAKTGVATVSYYESRLAGRVPGAGAHLSGHKNGTEPAQSRRA